MTSPEFIITGDLFTFLVGGGTHFLGDTNGETVVMLEVDGAMVFYATGNNTETMQRAVWNVSSFKGRVGRIRIVDADSGAWGHINCDDFQMLDAQGRRLPFSADPARAGQAVLSVRPLPSGADWTTTSTVFTRIADSSPPVRAPASALSSDILTDDHADLKITFRGEIEAPGGGRVFVRALVDGEVASPSDVVATVGWLTGVRSFTFVKTNVPTGTHSIAIQWHGGGGLGSCVDDRTLSVVAAPELTARGGLTAKAAPSGPDKTTTSTTGYDLLSADPDPNHVTLKWADGTPSGFTLQCMPSSGPDVIVGVTWPYGTAALAGPPLTIQQTGTSVLISWPAAYVCFDLEQTSQLGPSASWSPVALPSETVGDQFIVTVLIGPTKQFYRLHKP